MCARAYTQKGTHTQKYANTHKTGRRAEKEEREERYFYRD